jgi:hypothetical protein
MTSSTNILISLLEGNNGKEILELLCKTLDIIFLKKRLVDDYTSFVVNELGMPANTIPKII